MEQRLNQILARRRQSFALWFRGPSLTAAIALHVVLLLIVLLGPAIFAARQAPVEYVSVQVVPAHLLRPKPKPKPKPPPKPVEQPRPAPEPEPEPPPALVEETEETPPAPEPETTPEPEPAEPEPIAQDGPTAVLGLDNPDFVYGYYVDQMLAMIGANWQRPPLGAEIDAVIHFRIHRDGHISDVRVAKSSGYNSYDLAGLRAVQLAAPFPKLPQSFKHSSLGVNLILR